MCVPISSSVSCSNRSNVAVSGARGLSLAVTMQLAIGAWGTGTAAMGQCAISFATPVSASPGTLASGVTTGDLNADGRADLAYVLEFDGSLRWRLGNGNGTFSAEASISRGVSGARALAAVISTVTANSIRLSTGSPATTPSSHFRSWRETATARFSLPF